MRYTHQDLRHDIVHYLPTMFRNGHISETNFRITHGIPSEWQSRMARVNTEVDEVFIQIASEFLGRQFILYPVIPDERYEDRIIISPTEPSNQEPYHILLYEDINFNTPHYQSLRPRQTQSIIETPRNQESNQERPSMFARLSSLSRSQNISNARPSLDSVPEESVLMPPPVCQSSMIQSKKNKRKCDDVNVQSNSNSSGFDSSSFIRNSREKSYVDESNIQSGKRNRKERNVNKKK